MSREEELLSEVKCLSKFIIHWCKRIDEDSSWDGWDDCYKDAWSRKDEVIYKLIRKYNPEL